MQGCGQTSRNLTRSLESKHPKCMNMCLRICAKLWGLRRIPHQQCASTAPHQVVGGAFARAHVNTMLEYLTKHLEKCISALILDCLACMALQEHFANSFRRNVDVSEARTGPGLQHQGPATLFQRSFPGSCYKFSNLDV